MALEKFTDAYEFKVDFILTEVEENQTMYEASTEDVSVLLNVLYYV